MALLCLRHHACAVSAAGGPGPGVALVSVGPWDWQAGVPAWQLTATLWSQPQAGVRGGRGQQQGLPRAGIPNGLLSKLAGLRSTSAAHFGLSAFGQLFNLQSSSVRDTRISDNTRNSAPHLLCIQEMSNCRMHSRIQSRVFMGTPNKQQYPNANADASSIRPAKGMTCPCRFNTTTMPPPPSHPTPAVPASSRPAQSCPCSTGSCPRCTPR